MTTEANQKFGVAGTPSIFVNGQQVTSREALTKFPMRPIAVVVRRDCLLFPASKPKSHLILMPTPPEPSLMRRENAILSIARQRDPMATLASLRQSAHMTAMTGDSKIFVGLRSIRGKTKIRSEPSGENCHWDGCVRVGHNRAPIGQEAEGRFFLFCAEHVKEYNGGYNYVSALSRPDIARYQREAASGARKSLGKAATQADETPLPSEERSGSAKAINARRKAQNRDMQKIELQKRKLRVLEAKAFETLGLSEDATPEEIRVRYKERLKQLHPDANDGSRQSEDQLRASIDAHKILKLNGFC